MKKYLIKLPICMLILFSLISTYIFGNHIYTQAASKNKKITMNKSKITLAPGGRLQLKVKKVKPAKAGKAVSYTSSNKKVVTVNKQGVVKAKKAGTAKIVIVSKKDKEIKTTVTVKVQKNTKNNSKPSTTVNPPVTQNTVTPAPTIPVQTPTPTVQPAEQSPEPTSEPKMFDNLQDLYFDIIVNNFSSKLNSETKSQIAINLADAGSLSDSDKQNLVDLIFGQYGKKTIQKTFDELKEEGIIVNDSTYGFIIKDTVLIQIRETEKDPSGVTFNISCTVHGLDGVGYDGCKALKQNGKWICQLGKKPLS